MNPFITLTNTSGEKVRINVNHIVTYQRRAYKKQYGQTEPTTYTYVLLVANCTREIQEQPEEIDELINHAVFTIPFTRTQLKGA